MFPENLPKNILKCYRAPHIVHHLDRIIFFDNKIYKGIEEDLAEKPLVPCFIPESFCSSQKGGWQFLPVAKNKPSYSLCGPVRHEKPQVLFDSSIFLISFKNSFSKRSFKKEVLNWKRRLLKN